MQEQSQKYSYEISSQLLFACKANKFINISAVVVHR